MAPKNAYRYVTYVWLRALCKSFNSLFGLVLPRLDVDVGANVNVNAADNDNVFLIATFEQIMLYS